MHFAVDGGCIPNLSSTALRFRRLTFKITSRPT
jgi:hypothetical protein